jgi:HEAT repeat protein
MPSRLAQHLVQRGLLPAHDVERAQQRQAAKGGGLDTALLELGAISEPGVLQAIADVTGLRLVNLADFEPNSDAFQLIPASLAERLGLVPLSTDENSIHLACGYPPPLRELEEVGLLLAKRLEMWIATEPRIREWIATIYDRPLPGRFAAVLASLEPGPPALATRAAPIGRQGNLVLVEEHTLEEGLAKQMVETLAAQVADEPIPLEFKKGGKPEPRTHEVPAPATRTSSLRRGLADRDQTREYDLSELAAQSEPEKTVAVDVRKLVAEEALAPEPLPVGRRPTQPPFTAAQAPASTHADPAFSRRTTEPELPVVQVPSLTWEELEATGKRPAPAIAPEAARSPTEPASPGATGQLPGAPRPKDAPQPRQPPRRTTTSPEFPAVLVTPPESSSGARVPSAGPAPQPPPTRRAATSPAFPALAETPPAPTPAWGAAAVRASAAASTSGEETLRDPRQQTQLYGRAESGWREPPPRPATQPEFPAVVVFSDPASPHYTPPPPTAVPPAPLPERTAWTQAQALAAMREATHDRDGLVQVALGYAQQTFDFVAAFAVVRGAAVGWSGLGVGGERVAAERLVVPLDAASVFRTVAITRSSYVGPLPPDGLSAHYLGLLGRSPRAVFFYPVEVRGRLVCLLYGDCDQRPISQRKLAELILFCQELSSAFEALLVYRKQRYGVRPGLALGDDDPKTDPMGIGWTPAARGSQLGGGRAAGVPGQVTAEVAGRVDLAPVHRRLVGPDLAQRTAAMAELNRTPKASAAFLAAHFPGPTAWMRTAVAELPDPDELGPVPAALTRLGRHGATALAPVLHAPDPDARYYALLCAGALPFPELADGVMGALFDLDPDIASAARAAAPMFKDVPQFQAGLPWIREQLLAEDPLRRSLAARALGALHDRASIDPLIAICGWEDELSAQAAADALRLITRADYGQDPLGWSAWWAQNRERRRAEWLVDALEHEEFELRLEAIEELSRALHDNLGYFADGEPFERAGAVERWRAMLAQSPWLAKLEG